MARFALQAEIWDRLPDSPGCTPSTPPSYDYHYRWFNEAELPDVLAQIERKPGRKVRVTRIEWLHTATHEPLGSIMDADSPNKMINDLGDVFFPDNPEDAEWFKQLHGARYVHQDPFEEKTQ